MAESRFEFIPGTGNAPNPEAALDIVFVHGLTGDWKGTWTTPSDVFWPAWIAADFPQANVYSAGYDSAFFADILKGDGATLADRATILLDALSCRETAGRPIVFVTHSLGGLIVKQLLRKSDGASDAEKKKICAEAKGIAFLATPHLGSSLANSVNAILGLATSTTAKELKHNSEWLIDLGEWFSNWATTGKLPVVAYYETSKTKGVLIVDKSSANPNVHGCDPTAVQADHISITKPTARTAPVYRSICAYLKRLLKAVSPSSGSGGLDPDIAADFEAYQETTSDRRTLAEKLTDGGRTEEIRRAQEGKERFNMALQRNISHASAVSKYARLMSNVETRFNRHVTPKINVSEPNAQISISVQDDVIDPTIKAHKASGEDISTRLAEDALYYLTGNCHIRWDA